MRTRTRITAVVAAVAVGVTAAVACAGSQAQAACAIEAKSSGATKSPGVAPVARPAATTPKAPVTKAPVTAAKPPASVDRSKAPDPPAYPAGGGAKQGETRPPPPKTYQRNSGQQDRARRSASNPRVQPAADDVIEARDEAPRHLTRGGTFNSNITNIEYHYHDDPFGWYARPGLLVDIYDVYDPYNYYVRRRSPFFGMPYAVAGSCSDGDDKAQPVSPPQNINITVTADGHVAGTVPATTVAAGPTTTTTTAPPVGSDGAEAPPTTVGTEVIVP